MSYVTWEQYSALYDDIEEKDFERLENAAEVKIDTITRMQVMGFMLNYNEETATAFHKKVKKQIEQTTVDLIHTRQLMLTQGAGAGVSSVSNEGYSVSFKISTQSDYNDTLVSIVRNGLSGTGLTGVL